ncbi:hypothetical protein SMIDD22_01139 [Streptococcus mitis]|uniref:Uncharacterized protein n=1 Tax=Streptococcus mitis TaxID=28037 RepID=A0A139RAR6_STRMT|nr:hypothetical protein HMPREF1045_1606 [Streptococcus mitis SK616]KXU11851.1 hypothetical protein SMIDD22_01139 [Streptococcus mitis]
MWEDLLNFLQELRFCPASKVPINLNNSEKRRLTKYDYFKTKL